MPHDTRIIKVDEFKFKIIYEPKGGVGEWHRPGEWYAILVECPYKLMYAQRFGETIETLEQACDFIRPNLIKVVDSWRKKNAA